MRDLHGHVEEARDVGLQILPLTTLGVALGHRLHQRAETDDGVIEGGGELAELVARLDGGELGRGRPTDLRSATRTSSRMGDVMRRAKTTAARTAATAKPPKVRRSVEPALAAAAVMMVLSMPTRTVPSWPASTGTAMSMTSRSPRPAGSL